MKKLSMLVVLFCVSLMSMAQDVIVKKDGSTIQSKVMEISGTEIKYKKWSNQDGPMYTINRNEVNSINYQNGEIDLFSRENVINQNADQPSWSTNGRMERDGRDLVLDGRELTDEEVLSLVGQENYETYLSARKQITVGRVFTPVFWTLIGATAFLIVSAYYISPDYYYMNNTWYSTANEGLLIAGCITSAFANVSLPLMCVFKCAGKGRMNWVADEYNKSRSASAFSYQISPSIMKCNSMESQNNLGVGLTFSLNF